MGPFPEKDGQGAAYIDIRFHVKAAGNRTDGTPGQVSAQSTEVTLYFKTSPADDDDDGDDSPIGGIVPLAGILLAGALLFRKKRD